MLAVGCESLIKLRLVLDTNHDSKISSGSR